MENQDPTDVCIKLESRITYLLRKLKNSGVISNTTYRSLLPTGSRPGLLYGLPKVHKQSVPLRPIISAIGTFSYKVAKHLVGVFDFISTNEYTIRNTFSFLEELKSIKVPDGAFMASFDVTSLFTNIPLDETIQICLDNYVKGQGNTSEVSVMRGLLKLCTSESAFTFDGCLYRQRDGVAMGSPLGPLLANVFMSHNECIWLANCPSEFKPILYRRYVDDTFVIFRSPEHVTPFLDYLNTRHSNIKFTVEQENNGRLPFLDILINRSHILETSVFRKPTFTGLYTNFRSFIPEQYKTNLIQTLLSRAYKLCSNYISITSEFDKIKTLLLTNGYPKRLIDKYIRVFLDKRFKPTQPVHTVPRKVLYFVTPFTGQHGLQVKRTLTKLFRKHFPMAELRVVFKSGPKLSQLFPVKDSIPSALRSNVVYEFRCSGCSARYVGKTTRNLSTRISEHLGVSSRTGKQLTAPSFSAIRQHGELTGHALNAGQFRVVTQAPSSTDLDIYEALVIQKSLPSLNTMIKSCELHLFSE